MPILRFGLGGGEVAVGAAERGGQVGIRSNGGAPAGDQALPGDYSEIGERVFP